MFTNSHFLGGGGCGGEANVFSEEVNNVEFGATFFKVGMGGQVGRSKYEKQSHLKIKLITYN